MDNLPKWTPTEIETLNCAVSIPRDRERSSYHDAHTAEFSQPSQDQTLPRRLKLFCSMEKGDKKIMKWV